MQAKTLQSHGEFLERVSIFTVKKYAHPHVVVVTGKIYFGVA